MGVRFVAMAARGLRAASRSLSALVAVTDFPPRADRAPSASGSALEPIAATVALSAVVCLGTGVRVWELLAFAAYEAGFVVAPGVLLLRALIPGAMSRATLLAIGWPLGIA